MKAPNKRRTETRSVRLRGDEVALLDQAARIRNEPVTRWMRETLVRAARRILRETT